MPPTVETLTTIPSDFGQGGANLSPGGGSGKPDLVTILTEHKTAIEELLQGKAGTFVEARFATVQNDSLTGLAARDGVTPVAGDIALVKNHVTASSKGLYVVTATGTWTRLKDAAGLDILKPGMIVSVSEGTVNADTRWALTTDAPITVGTTALTFSTGGSGTGGVQTVTGMADFYIDSSAGDDTLGTGLVGAPVRTWAEFNRRLCLGSAAFVGGKPVISWAMIVHIVNDLPSSDPIVIDAVLTGTTFQVIAGGTLAVPYTGTFTTVILPRATTNAPCQVTDTALGGTTWTTVGLGSRIRVTSGARANAMAWVVKDQTSNVARTSGPSLYNQSPTSTQQAASSFVAADPYSVETLRKCYMGNFRVVANTAGSTTQFPTVSFVDMQFLTGGFAEFMSPVVEGFLAFHGCRLDATFISYNGNFGIMFLSCCFTGGFQNLGGFVHIVACAFIGTTPPQCMGGLTDIDFDTIVQGGFGLTVGGGADCVIGNVGIFDATGTVFNPAGDGLFFGASSVSRNGGGLVIETPSGGAGHTLYGSGNAGVGLHLNASAKFDTTVPTITGTGGDFQLGLVKTGRSFDPAGTGVYSTGEIATTWANFSAAVDNTHFGKNAHNLNQDVHFTQK